jgi:hypothetical protein
VWRLRCDLASTYLLVTLARGLRGGSLRPEVHLYFADRYGRLARCHRERRQERQARRCDELAIYHYRLGDFLPPGAKAMALPVPMPPTFTNAVSPTSRLPDDVA